MAEEDRNKIIISVIFKLKPGAKDKRDESQQIILKEFPSDTISSEREDCINDELKCVYHHMLMRYYDPKILNYLNTLIFEEKQSEYSPEWYNEEPLDQQVYIKYKTGESVGCPHYIRGCDLQCPICKQFYCCRMCHDESGTLDHTFPRYEVTTVRCKRCKAI